MATVAITASAASAATFFVDGKGKSATCLGQSEAAACPTIKDAILAALLFPKPNTIEVAPDGPVGGAYEESIELENAHSGDLTISGEATGVKFVVHGAHPAVSVVAAAGPATLSNLKVKTEGGDPSATVEDAGATLTLDDVEVENESSSGINGIEVLKGAAPAPGTMTMNGGGVVMEGGASNWAIAGLEAPMAINGATVEDTGLSEAGGISSTRSTLSVDHSSVHVEDTVTPHAALVLDQDTAASLEADSVNQESEEPGVQILRSTASVNGLEVAVKRPGGKLPGVEAEGSTATLAHLTVGGSWSGTPLVAEASNLTLLDSRLIANPAGLRPALKSSEEGSELVIERSLLEAAPKAVPAVLDTAGGNVTIDSSEIFGGTAGVLFDNAEEGTRTLTLAASTVGPAPGLGSEPNGVVGIDAEAQGTHASANVSIEGSILIESQLAKAATGDNTAVACSYSAVPSQIQTANPAAHAGEISCAGGAGGNTNSSAESTSLFAEPDPLHSYKLSPSSSAVDSVPVSAITLPFGLTPSPTDLEGNPRFESVACNLLQDKGALELTGNSSPCPAPRPAPIINLLLAPKALAGVISSLTLSRSAFLPAPSGATLSTPKGKAKKYGTKISYRDSQVAKTTLTVFKKSSGRKPGRVCERRSARNRHGKHCTLFTKVGSFTHADKAGANSFHFSGRLKGKKLLAGGYELEVVAHDAAGNGAAVTKSFTIK
jgi:hypothetical protein